MLPFLWERTGVSSSPQHTIHIHLSFEKRHAHTKKSEKLNYSGDLKKVKLRFHTKLLAHISLQHFVICFLKSVGSEDIWLGSVWLSRYAEIVSCEVVHMKAFLDSQGMLEPWFFLGEVRQAHASKKEAGGTFQLFLGALRWQLFLLCKSCLLKDNKSGFLTWLFFPSWLNWRLENTMQAWIKIDIFFYFNNFLVLPTQVKGKVLSLITRAISEQAAWTVYRSRN